MNLSRKVQRQERRIAILENQAKDYEDEIRRLKETIHALKERNAALEVKAGVAIAARNEYTACLEEVAELKAKYQQAIYDAQKIKKEYTQRFNRLLDRVKAKK